MKNKMEENYNSNIYVSPQTEGMGLHRGYLNHNGEKVEKRIAGRKSSDAMTFFNYVQNPERMEKVRKLNERRSVRKSIRNLLK